MGSLGRGGCAGALWLGLSCTTSPALCTTCTTSPALACLPNFICCPQQQPQNSLARSNPTFPPNLLLSPPNRPPPSPATESCWTRRGVRPRACWPSSPTRGSGGPSWWGWWPRKACWSWTPSTCPHWGRSQMGRHAAALQSTHCHPTAFVITVPGASLRCHVAFRIVKFSQH